MPPSRARASQGVSWTYVLSTAAGIASTLDPNAVLYQTTMDQLNYFMRERSLPGKLRKELRHYFEVARHVLTLTLSLTLG